MTMRYHGFHQSDHSFAIVFARLSLKVLYVPYGLVGRSYNISEGPGDLGVPEKFTFPWNHAYLVQNCAKNAIQTRKFWEKCTADCFF